MSEAGVTAVPEDPDSASNRFMISAIAGSFSSAIAYIFYFFLSFNSHGKQLNPEGEAKREHKVGELALFHPCNQLLEVVLRKLARVFFKDGLRGLDGWRVKQHDRGHILSERLPYARELTG